MLPTSCIPTPSGPLSLRLRYAYYGGCGLLKGKKENIPPAACEKANSYNDTRHDDETMTCRTNTFRESFLLGVSTGKGTHNLLGGSSGWGSPTSTKLIRMRHLLRISPGNDG